MATTVDPVEVLRNQAEEIEARIQPARDAIAADEQMLARLRAAIDVLSGDVAVSSGASRADAFRAASARSSSTTSGRRPRGQVKEAIFAAVKDRPGATAAEIASIVGGSKNSITSSLQKYAGSGELTKESLPSGGVGFRLP